MDGVVVMKPLTILPILLFSAALVISGLRPAEAPEPLEPAEAIMTYRIIEERTMPREEPQKPEPMIFESTAYCYTGNRTATGTWPQEGRTVAADPNVLPYGTEISINGRPGYIVEDCGGNIKGNRLDIYVNDYSYAVYWGRQQVEVRIIE